MIIEPRTIPRLPMLASVAAIAVSLLIPADAQPNASATTNTPPRAGGFAAGNNAATQADHRKMMDLLGITSIRRGRDGNNPQSTNYANQNFPRQKPCVMVTWRSVNMRAVTPMARTGRRS